MGQTAFFFFFLFNSPEKKRGLPFAVFIVCSRCGLNKAQEKWWSLRLGSPKRKWSTMKLHEELKRGAQYWRGEMMMVPSKEREKKKNKKTH